MVSDTIESHRQDEQRLNVAREVQLRDAEPLHRIQKHLEMLTAKVGEQSGAVFLAIEEDVPIAICGNFVALHGFAEDEENILFSGEAVHNQGEFIYPLWLHGFVVGYIVLTHLSGKLGDLSCAMVELASMLISRELELADKTASLEYQNEQIGRKQRQLEQAISFKNNILSLTTHDLRSPLTAINGFMDMMAENLRSDHIDPLSLDELKTCHRSMESGLRSVNDMVEQLHEIALLELERIDLAMIKVDINWIVQEVCDILQGRAISKKQALEFERNQYPLYVEVDIPKIKRVLFNLVGNAIKYTHNGGKIRVMVEKDLGMAMIRVSDTGIGIPKEKLGVIFEPFSKLKSRGTNGEASNGLGLFTANYMTRLFKGSISVVSQEGQGSTFTLRLPLVVNI